MHYKWGGVEFQKRDKIAMCSGHPVALPGRSKPPFWSYDMVNNHLFFSSYHMGGDTLEYYIKKLENFDPLLIHGYPSSVYLLALAYKKYGKKKLALKSIYTSSETLLAFQRKTIEEAFGVKVYNWYGTSEMTANIVECECGELHLKAEHSFTEILKDNNEPCKPGETGRIVSTNFNNIAFPLIRYDVGDMATVAINQVAKCERSGLLITHIEGRKEDYIVTPDGRVIGRLDHLFKDAVNVMEAQIIQEVKEEIVLRIVKKETYTQNDEQLILNEARVRLGNVIRITFEYVEKIPRAKSGKYQFIISKIQRSATNILQ
jgi:phenylacetate-CoA ligase